jgi:prophage regulatory protein
MDETQLVTDSAKALKPCAKRILRLPEVITKTGMSRDTIYRLGRLNKFPRPLSLTGARASGWLETEVDEFIRTRVVERDRTLSRERVTDSAEALQPCLAT